MNPVNPDMRTLKNSTEDSRCQKGLKEGNLWRPPLRQTNRSKGEPTAVIEEHLVIPAEATWLGGEPGEAQEVFMAEEATGQVMNSEESARRLQAKRSLL